MENSNTGHDWGKPRLDTVAVFYIAFAILHTIVVLVGLYVLFLLRRTTAVRLRSFRTICTTVLTLHIYLVLILVSYPLNGLYKCGVEFWVMSTFLPFGMALFQGTSILRNRNLRRLIHIASNIRLLAYYEAQQALVDSVYLREKSRQTRLSKLKAWWQYSSCVDKTYAGIKLGLAIQVSHLLKPSL